MALDPYFAPGDMNLPYLNIEAENNHLNAQIDMVRAAHEMVEGLGLVKKK